MLLGDEKLVGIRFILRQGVVPPITFVIRPTFRDLCFNTRVRLPFLQYMLLSVGAWLVGFVVPSLSYFV